MGWQEELATIDRNEIVEFGMHQMDLKTRSPRWRRHRGGPQMRFLSLRNALFSHDKGARVACLGKSTYAAKAYAAGLNAIVPYVGAWLQGRDLAFLVRAAAAEPEVALVPTSELATIRDEDHHTLLSRLGDLFGRGASKHGVRLLASGEVRVL